MALPMSKMKGCKAEFKGLAVVRNNNRLTSGERLSIGRSC